MAKLYCEHCHNWQRLAQPGKEPIGWCPKQEPRMGANQFCIDHFDPIYSIPAGGEENAQGPPH